jgi:cystathionine beta-lyase/cystathionine gamma-synthase
MKKKVKHETLLMHYAEKRSDYKGAVVPPIFQNSLFTFEDWDSIDHAFDDRAKSFIYTRGKNPTVNIVQEKLAALAGGQAAQLFPSGMAAISAAILHFLSQGDHMVAIRNIYGPASNLIQKYLVPKMGIQVTLVDGDDAKDFSDAIQPNTKLFYLESPSTAVFKLQDLKAITKLAKSKKIKTIIDNTWATPVFQKPLAMGIDMEMHSISKYISGHSDVVAGLLIGSKKDLDSIFKREYEWLGAKIAPFEAWLILRSLRTLPIRLQMHQESARKVAKYLESHPKVKLVRYPGLKSFPQYKLGRKQMSGYTGLMSFQLKTEKLPQIKKFVNALEIFSIGVSWGGHESLVYAPAISYLKELDPARFKQLGISLGDIRISVGLENADDLMEDLNQALRKIK